MIILGQSHDRISQGAQTPDGLTEWIIAGEVNEAIRNEIRRRKNKESTMRLGGSLYDRIKTIKHISKSKFNCVVECHCNTFPHAYQHGFSVLAWHRSKKSLHLADCILDEIEKARPSARNRGVCKVAADLTTPERDTVRWVGDDEKEHGKSSWLGLLTDTPCPAVIVEACYLTNPEEVAWISDETNRQSLGCAIGRGVDNWLKELKKESES
jgi:N-acetylmuramoyl-L-alanine amidase